MYDRYYIIAFAITAITLVLIIFTKVKKVYEDKDEKGTSGKE